MWPLLHGPAGNSLEVGRGASMRADAPETKEFEVTLHYSLPADFPSFFDRLANKALTLFPSAVDFPHQRR